jgi:hypothetical protein
MVQDHNLLDWDATHGYRFTHDWFRFPGKFHPPLVEHLLRSIRPNAVVDPMAGVGTVAVEAKAAGIPSLSIDVDPVSAFFTRVKTTPISKRTLVSAWDDLSDSLQRFRRTEREVDLRMFRDIRIDSMREHLDAVQARDFERLTYWFRRYVLVDYARIDHSIMNGGLPGRSEAVRRFFLACLVSSVRRISLADPSPVSGVEITRPMRERINRGYQIDVFRQFERRVELAIRRMDEYSRYLQEHGTYLTPSHIEQGDCLEVLDVGRRRPVFRADLILFSPPYCNAIEYWRRHRLEYLLGRFLDEQGIINLSRSFVGKTTVGQVASIPPKLGYDPVDRLIAHLNDQNRNHKARVLWQYFDNMKKRLEVFQEYLPSKGHCVIVVGNSETGGRKVPTVKTITWFAERAGFKHLKTSQYQIKNRVMQFPTNSHPKIKNESIILLEKS